MTERSQGSRNPDHTLTQLFHEDAELAALRDELDAWESYIESSASALRCALRRAGRPMATRALEELTDYLSGSEPDPDEDRDLPF